MRNIELRTRKGASMRHRSFAIWICPLLVCFLALLGCSKEERSIYSPSAAPLTGDPGQENCGFDLGEEVPDGPIIDPCGPDAQRLHGPVTLNPDPGTPALDSVVLPIPEEGFICVTLNVEKIASATVTLNGEPLFEPRDFNARVSELSRVAAVEQGEALLEFEIRATPHGSFTYQVRYIPLDPVPRGEVSGGNNRLSVYNLRDHPDPFSPKKQDGIRDTVTMSVTASVAREGISPRSANEYVVYGTFEIASPDSCQEIARLTTQLTLAEATPTSTDRKYVVPLTVVWDGRDNTGAIVDGGTYFYRAVAELVKVTPPGSSQLLDVAYSEILTVTNDDVPPVITLSPANGSQVDTDMPLLEVSYTDDASGVDESTLLVLLNGKDVTANFDASDTQATAQVDIDWYLEEGPNVLAAAVSDNAGNRGSAVSVFNVHTPTEVLLEDLKSTDERYRHRSAYKLVCRVDELDPYVLRRCLRQLSETPEPKAVDCIFYIIQSGAYESDVIAIACDALGEAFGKEPSRATEEMVETLNDILLNHPSYFPKAGAVRALGFAGLNSSLQEEVLRVLVSYKQSGPNEPKPPDFKIDPIGWGEHYAAITEFKWHVARSIIRIAGEDYDVGNPSISEIWEDAVNVTKEYLERRSRNGGAP